MDSTKSVATCGLCSQFFSDPRILPCLHSFCFGCLQKHLKIDGNQSDQFSCPTCVESFSLPEGALAALPKDLRKNYEVEMVRFEVKMNGEVRVACDRCILSSTENIAICFCYSCCKFLCSKCKADHLRCKETFEHELVNVGNGSERGDKKKLTILPRKFDYCPEHNDETLKFFCVTCSKLICRDCIVLSHYEHSRDRVEVVAKKEKEDLGLLLERTNSTVKELESSLRQGTKIIQMIQQNKKLAERKVHEEFRTLYERIQRQEKKLIARISEISFEKETALKLQQEPIIATKEHLKVMATKIRELICHYTPAELLFVNKTIKNKFEKNLHKANSIQTCPVVTEKIMAIFPEAMTIEIEQFGVVTGGCCARTSTASLHMLQAIEGEEIKFVVTAKDIAEVNYGCGGDPVFVQLHLVGSEEFVQGNVQDNNDGTYLVSVTPCITGNHLLNVTIGTDHICSSPFLIYVRKPRIYTNSLEIKKIFPRHNFGFCYVAVDDNNVFVTNNTKDITVFDKSTAAQIKNIELSYGSSAFGISFYQNFLFISDRLRKCLHKISLDGTIVSTFGNDLKGAHGLCVSLEGLLYVAECNTDQIFVFEIDGTLKKCITGNMHHPCGISIDCSGNIHVANYKGNSITVFTSEGEFLKHYGSGHVVSPVGIAMGPDGFSFVSEYRSSGSSHLVVFDQLGSLHSKQSLGSSLKGGYGIALDKDGDIYVCDSLMCRTLQL